MSSEFGPDGVQTGARGGWRDGECCRPSAGPLGSWFPTEAAFHANLVLRGTLAPRPGADEHPIAQGTEFHPSRSVSFGAEMPVGEDLLSAARRAIQGALPEGAAVDLWRAENGIDKVGAEIEETWAACEAEWEVGDLEEVPPAVDVNVMRKIDREIMEELLPDLPIAEALARAGEENLRAKDLGSRRVSAEETRGEIPVEDQREVVEEARKRALLGSSGLTPDQWDSLPIDDEADPDQF